MRQQLLADRKFCIVGSTCEIDDKGACLIFRQHGKFPIQCFQRRKQSAKLRPAKYLNSQFVVVDKHGKEHQFRRIRLLLKKATRDGDKEIFVITNLPKKAAGAKKIAPVYRGRWTIETSFQELTQWFNSEINTLGYPPAALFGFCVALISYMIVSAPSLSLSLAINRTILIKTILWSVLFPLKSIIIA